MIRLQVVLARYGLASRRGVVEMIDAGRVQVNGQVVREKGHRVDSEADTISVDGRELAKGHGLRKRWFLFYKPKGVMTTLQDPHAESTVGDFFGDVSERLFPVGRLDRDTTGLLLMTNDGELAFRLMHPRYGVPKRYRAEVAGAVPDATLKRLEKGVELEEGVTAPCQIKVEDRRAKQTILTIQLHEGKKRQIRRIFEKVGHRVETLHRFQYGPLTLGDLRPGERRELTDHELSDLERACLPARQAAHLSKKRDSAKREEAK